MDEVGSRRLGCRQRAHCKDDQQCRAQKPFCFRPGCGAQRALLAGFCMRLASGQDLECSLKYVDKIQLGLQKQSSIA